MSFSVSIIHPHHQHHLSVGQKHHRSGWYHRSTHTSRSIRPFVLLQQSRIATAHKMALDKLVLYGAASTAFAAAVISNALSTRQNFYAAAVQIGRSSGAIMVG